ncbi:MAG TPA: head-tail connector protein [Allosphingosinicella sp.]|nr:head-tail connector protein [Allosphingosinicella sp.]
MTEGDPLLLPAAAAEAAKSYLRVERSDEDGLIARLVAAAGELCEGFTRQALIVRAFEETMPASRAWQRLERTPVRAITSVGALDAAGAATPLAVGAYAIDIDANGDGWVRIEAPGRLRRVRVAYSAGLAADWDALPAALRQGILRLAAHFYAHRTAEPGRGSEDPPAAVSALWSPYRRLRLR